MLKDAFLAFLTQKLAPSRVLNAIIFCIDEQCNLIFETVTNCKIYIIFLFRQGPLSFLLCLSHFRFFPVSPFLCSHSFPTRRSSDLYSMELTFFSSLSFSFLFLPHLTISLLSLSPSAQHLYLQTHG